MNISQRAVEARESARERSGEFGEQLRSEPEAGLLAQLDLTSHTPVDIDGFLSDQLNKLSIAHRNVEWASRETQRAEKSLAKAETEGERYDGQLTWLRTERDKTLEKLDDAEAAVADIRADMAPYEMEFDRRGGWPRAFITTGSAPHVHSSMDCSTCNKMGQMTRFGWLTQYSGKTEEEIVADAGERACTTCYPSAPVDVLSRPTKMFTEDEERRARERDERAAAKVERDAKRIRDGLTADGSEFTVDVGAQDERGRQRREHFKTERSAVIWATDYYHPDARDLDDAYDESHREHLRELYSEYNAAVQEIAEAVAAKHARPVEYVLEEFAVKAALKRKTITAKEGRERMAAAAERWNVTG